MRKIVRKYRRKIKRYVKKAFKLLSCTGNSDTVSIRSPNGSVRDVRGGPRQQVVEPIIVIPDVEVPELRPRRRERLEAAISFVNGSVEVHSPSSDRWARRHVRATIRFPSNPMIMVPRPQSGDERFHRRGSSFPGAVLRVARITPTWMNNPAPFAAPWMSTAGAASMAHNVDETNPLAWLEGDPIPTDDSIDWLVTNTVAAVSDVTDPIVEVVSENIAVEVAVSEFSEEVTVEEVSELSEEVTEEVVAEEEVTEEVVAEEEVVEEAVTEEEVTEEVVAEEEVTEEVVAEEEVTEEVVTEEEVVEEAVTEEEVTEEVVTEEEVVEEVVAEEEVTEEVVTEEEVVEEVVTEEEVTEEVVTEEEVTEEVVTEEEVTEEVVAEEEVVEEVVTEEEVTEEVVTEEEVTEEVVAEEEVTEEVVTEEEIIEEVVAEEEVTEEVVAEEEVTEEVVAEEEVIEEVVAEEEVTEEVVTEEEVVEEVVAEEEVTEEVVAEEEIVEEVVTEGEVTEEVVAEEEVVEEAVTEEEITEEVVAEEEVVEQVVTEKEVIEEVVADKAVDRLVSLSHVVVDSKTSLCVECLKKIESYVQDNLSAVSTDVSVNSSATSASCQGTSLSDSAPSASCPNTSLSVVGIEGASKGPFSGQPLCSSSRSLLELAQDPENKALLDKIHGRNQDAYEATLPFYIMKDGKLPHPTIFQFHQPLFAHGDFGLHVLHHKVSLEYCLYGNGDFFTGFIRVSNSAPHKRVFVRYTLDNWASSTDVTANLIHNNFREERSDRFVFDLPYHNPGCTDFAICYESKGAGIWWDNNHCKNYRVGLNYDY